MGEGDAREKGEEFLSLLGPGSLRAGRIRLTRGPEGLSRAFVGEGLSLNSQAMRGGWGWFLGRVSCGDRRDWRGVWSLVE